MPDAAVHAAESSYLPAANGGLTPNTMIDQTTGQVDYTRSSWSRSSWSASSSDLTAGWARSSWSCDCSLTPCRDHRPDSLELEPLVLVRVLDALIASHRTIRVDPDVRARPRPPRVRVVCAVGAVLPTAAAAAPSRSEYIVQSGRPPRASRPDAIDRAGGRVTRDLHLIAGYAARLSAAAPPLAARLRSRGGHNNAV